MGIALMVLVSGMIVSIKLFFSKLTGQMEHYKRGHAMALELEIFVPKASLTLET